MPPRPRVLCAEPSADVCSFMRALLDANGMDSDSASTVAEAVGKAAARDYCLYIVDDFYPDGTNVELIRRLRALTPGVPVLVYGSASYEAIRRDAARAGAVAYVVKPGDIERHAGVVTRLCVGG